MRKYVPVEAIINLSETQKGALRDLWQPEQYDRIIIPICQDVERDLYSYEIYVIKDIVINAINQDKRFNTFRVPVHGYDYYQMFFEVAPVTDPAISEEFAQLDDDTIEDYDNDNTDDDVDSEIFFNKEECLPFLDISQLMAMIFSN
ncbi:MAG TPA: hypothetical protein PLZ08_05835, partial [Bacillota bacterium]|nr:hypothetical protein [Bacillota bacterium]HPO97464.1 hypothetical protein [Bacillota bacterium]